MSAKDLSKAWDEAAQRALEASQEAELTPQQCADAAGLSVRTGLAAGGWWSHTKNVSCDSSACTGFC